VITIDDIAKEVAKRTGEDIETVTLICKHPFKQTVEIMKDVNNYNDVLFNGLFKFKLKKRFNEDKTKQYR